MEFFLIWVSIFVALFALHHFFIPKSRFFGSDESFHIYCIKKIKWNSHRFFKSSPEFALPDWKYPLLYHWCLSFFPLEWVRSNSRKVALLIDILNYLICFGVIFSLMPEVDGILFFSLSALFIINPNAMNVVNARNTGLSARGFGGTFAIACFAFLWSYDARGDIGLLIFASVMFALVLLSSEMAIQAIVLGSVTMSIMMLNASLLLVLPVGFIIAHIVSGGYAKETVLYKLDHLHIYRKYLAKIFILNKRESIWLDFLKVPTLLRKKGLLKTAKYYWNSPLANLFIDFPLNLLFLIVLLNNFDESLSNPFFIMAIMPLSLFVMTSFSGTRFLGEPERYSEYFQVFSILFLLNQEFNFTYIFVAALVALIRICGNAVLFRATHVAAESTRVDMLPYLNKNDVVAANNLELTKSLLGELPEDQYYSVFYGGITKEFVHGVPFLELYEEYPEFNNDALLKLIDRTSANVCLIGQPSSKLQLMSQLNDIGFVPNYSDDNIAILRK